MGIIKNREHQKRKNLEKVTVYLDANEVSAMKHQAVTVGTPKWASDPLQAQTHAPKHKKRREEPCAVRAAPPLSANLEHKLNRSSLESHRWRLPFNRPELANNQKSKEKKPPFFLKDQKPKKKKKKKKK